ncbi:MAG: integrase core domain-containing protein [Polyangia bacterium]
MKIPARSPNCSPHAERSARTIKYECLNQFIIFGERHLRHLIKEFVEHYHTERFHCLACPLGNGRPRKRRVYWIIWPQSVKTRVVSIRKLDWVVCLSALNTAKG